MPMSVKFACQIAGEIRGGGGRLEFIRDTDYLAKSGKLQERVFEEALETVDTAAINTVAPVNHQCALCTLRVGPGNQQDMNSAAHPECAFDQYISFLH